MPFYQIAVPIICVFFILYAYMYYKQKKKSRFEFIVWTFIFSVIGIIALDNRFVQFARYLTGFQDSINAIIFLSIGIIFIILFRLVILHEQNEHSIDNIISEIALRDFKNEYLNKYKKEDEKNN